ncbi:MAG: hypothetical protein JRH20_04815 [Deltaproteobacteria bacterium]|nr:hypothetical protein [Deltaproteobacteria bacterium]
MAPKKADGRSAKPGAGAGKDESSKQSKDRTIAGYARLAGSGMAKRVSEPQAKPATKPETNPPTARKSRPTPPPPPAPPGIVKKDSLLPDEENVGITTDNLFDDEDYKPAPAGKAPAGKAPTGKAPTGKAPATPVSEPELDESSLAENTILLAEDDLEVYHEDESTASGLPLPPKSPPMPRKTDPFGTPIARGITANLSMDDLEPITVVPTPAKEPPAFEDDALVAKKRELSQIDSSEFYTQEAAALAGERPEHAALLMLEAAHEAKARGASDGEVATHLHKALKLAPESALVVPLLRSAFQEIAHHDDVLELSRVQLGAGGQTLERVAVALEAAAILYHQKNNARGALAQVEKALAASPAHIITLVLAVELQLELGAFDKAVASLEQLTEALSTPQDRSIYLQLAATLQETRLDQAESAAKTYGRAVDAAGDNLPALLALCDLLEALSHHEELARRLEQLAALDRDGAVAHLLRAGTLHLDRTRDLQAATRCFVGAVERDPTDLTPLLRLSYVLERRGKWKDLVEALRQLLSLTIDLAGKVALLTRIGWLQQNRLSQRDNAIEAYTQALRLQPGYLPALQAVGTLHRQQGNYEELLVLLLPETEGSDPPAARAIRSVEAGDILAEHLGREKDAIAAYRRALELRPGWQLVFWKLRRALRSAALHAESAELIAAQLEHLEDAKTRQHLLVELGDLLAGPLGRLDEGVEVLERARRLNTTRTAGLGLIDLYDLHHRHADRAKVLLEEADDTNDPEEAQAFRLLAAALFETQLDEPNRALDVYLKILAEHPQNASATRAAGRVYHRLERWVELIELYRHELKGDERRDHSSELLCRVARVYEENLGQASAAINAYTQALQRDPTNSIALDQLVRLVRREGRDKELVSTLERHAAQCKDPHATADALCRAGEICENCLGDDNAATSHYEAALEANKASVPALSGLTRVQLRKHDFAATAEALAALTLVLPDGSSARLHAELRVARLHEHRLQRQPDLAQLQAAMGASYAPYLRFDLTRAVRRELPERAAEALFALSQQTTDRDLSAAYALLAAQRDEFGGDPSRCVTEAQFALANSPTQPVLSWQLQRALRANGHFEALGRQLEQEASQEGDPAFRLPLLENATRAMLAAQRPDEAIRLARQALTTNKKNLPSLLALARMAEEGQRFSELAAYCDQLSAASAAHDNRLTLCLLASDLWARHAQDPVHALSSLQFALDDDPGQPDAFARAERLLLSTTDFDRLSRLYSRRISVATEPSQKVELLRLNARLIRDRLNDTTRAIAELTTLLSHAPRDIDALAEQAQLLAHQWRWSDTVGTLSTLIEVADDASVVHDAMLHQARIWLEHLHEPIRARGVLQDILANTPHDVEAQQILVGVHFSEGAWDTARELLDKLVESEELSLQVWALTQRAELARAGLRDEELRKASDKEALRRASANAPMLAQLRTQYAVHQESKRLAELLTEVIDETTDADVVSPLRLMVAHTLLELREPQLAIEHLRALAMTQPEGSEAQLLWAKAQEAAGDSEGAAQRYRQLVTHKSPETQVEAARGLSRLMSFLGQPAIASSAAALLLGRGEANSGEEQQVQALEQTGAPYGSLELSALAVPRELGPLHELLSLVLPHLSSVYKAKPADPLPGSHELVVATTQIATAFGLPAPKLSVEAEAALAGMPAMAGVGHPPSLYLRADLVRQGFTTRYRFWVGRALALAGGAGALFKHLSDAELDLFVTALLTPRPLDAATQNLRKQLTRALPRRTRKQVEQLTLSPPGPDVWSRYRIFEMQHADRAGLLVSSNPHVALTELGKSIGQGIDSPRLQELQRYSLSDDYARQYHALWTRSPA